MLEIDGSQGEGGGQIIRSSLALSLLTGTPVMLTNIRAKRKNSGLAKQHLVAVQAAAELSGAELRGASLGSSQLSFQPKSVQPGEYTFRIGTAGSASLVLQTILPPLLLAAGPSSLTIEGGTHNPLAPPADFLIRSYAPLVQRLGPVLAVQLDRHGFFPAGGGRLRVQIEPAPQLGGLELMSRGEILKKRVRALVSNLPKKIAERECHEIRRLSGWEKSCFHAEEVAASGCGNVVLIELECEHVTEVFAGCGERGIPAERVAAAVWQEAEEYLEHGAPVGPHLADQLILPLAIAASQGNASQFRTTTLTGHTVTHLDIVQRFLPVRFELNGPEKGVVDVRVIPASRVVPASTPRSDE
jgi:RNA 3'-terminal phosphate cyclase (ATP)